MIAKNNNSAHEIRAELAKTDWKKMEADHTDLFEVD